MNNLWTIFITGLFVGGLSCMAVQGGLLAAAVTQLPTDKKTPLPIVTFLISKLIAYTILGFILGLLGSVFSVSLPLKATLNIAVVIFMLGTAGNLLNLHPVFRYFVITPPKFLLKLARNQAKSKSIFAPALLGAFTVFIPCGTTQAMMALAVASGSPWQASLIMFAFVLGTSPLFFVLGYLVTKLGESLHQKFMKVAAVGIILLALFNLYNALSLAGVNFNFKPSTPSLAASSEATLTFTASGYSPENISLKAGSIVTLHLQNAEGRGCLQEFTIPRLGIQVLVPTLSSKTITFTAPQNKGPLPFMCSMGMFRGSFNVI